MSVTFYRAILTLERVVPFADDKGYERTNSHQLGNHTTYGDTAAHAMSQIVDHADTLHRAVAISENATNDQGNGAARLRIKAEALREAAGGAGSGAGSVATKWLVSQAEALEKMAREASS